jgi:hypothetical protein
MKMERTEYLSGHYFIRNGLSHAGASGEIFDFSWTADYDHLLMTLGQSKRDVVLLSHLRGE